jgi:hypothetical protein
MTKPDIMPAREWLAQLFECDPNDPPKARGGVDAELVAKAEAFFLQRTIELSAKEAAKDAHPVAVAGADPTFVIRAAFERALQQARRDTAKAIRDGEI